MNRLRHCSKYISAWDICFYYLAYLKRYELNNFVLRHQWSAFHLFTLSH